MTLIAALALVPGYANVTITPSKTLEGIRAVALAAAPTGSQFLATLEDGSVRIIDSRTRQTVRNLAKHPQPAYAAAWSADGNFVATGDETARIWIENARSGEKVREYRTHTRGIQKVSFNLPRTQIISTGKDDEIKIYDLTSASAKEARSILGKGANFYGATFNPRLPNKFATAVLTIGGGRQYDSNTGNVAGFLTGHDAQGALDVAFSPAGTRAATGGKDGSAAIYDTKGGTKLANLRGHSDWVINVAFSPNGKLLATSSTDRTVKVWDVASFKKVADIPSQSFVGSPLAFTGDGKTLITVNDQGYVQLHNVAPAQMGALPAPIKVKATKPTKRRRG